MIHARADGVPLAEVLDTVAAALGCEIVMNDASADAVRELRVEFIATQHIPADRGFDWLQAVLSYYSLVLIPLGDDENGAWRRWHLVQRADPL